MSENAPEPEALQVEASGNFEDGILRATVKAPGMEVGLRVDNDALEDGTYAVVMSSLDEALNQVMDSIVAQMKTEDAEDE